MDDTDPFVAFDLGGTYNLAAVKIWNYNEGWSWISRGVDQMVIEVSTDGGISYTPFVTVSLAEGPANDTTAFAETIPLVGASGVTHVRFDIVSNHTGATYPDGNFGDDWGFVGLSEVVFFDTSAPPPPPPTITTVSIESVSSELTEGPYLRSATTLIDGSGKDPNGPGTHMSGSPENLGGTMWLTDGVDFHEGGQTNDTDPFVAFDLGGTYNLAAVKIWNYNEGGSWIYRGVDQMVIEVSTDGGISYAPFVTVSLAQGPANDTTAFAETISLVGATGVTHVLFHILSNHWGATYPDGNYDDDWGFVGLSEVEFTETVSTNDLSITKSAAPDPVEVGALLTYSLVVANNGPNPADLVEVVDTFPAEVSVVSTAADCAEASGVVVCELSGLTGGTSIERVLTVDTAEVCADGVPVPLTNTATVENVTATAGPDVDPTDNSDTIVTQTVDSTPPVLVVDASPDTLWPPDHRMHEIILTFTVTDTCDDNPTIRLLSVTSDEPDNGVGDGNSVSDIQGADLGTADTSIELRAERHGGGDGRVYTLTYEVEDASGNASSATATVTVPHDQR
jgi:uncharacterized repeat protein (TIGR01451 family)